MGADDDDNDVCVCVKGGDERAQIKSVVQYKCVSWKSTTGARARWFVCVFIVCSFRGRSTRRAGRVIMGGTLEGVRCMNGAWGFRFRVCA